MALQQMQKSKLLHIVYSPDLTFVKELADEIVGGRLHGQV